ncbi:unnamed protein product [Spirodela intermedia]|uniref:Uncharacterized protein n=1 Tax=Spirodela intermedia TaxID=51605 RepID=A0A7I8KMZ4_SPIIN|nr:unnamed protein product [Spirodela intermedia]
MPFPLKIQPIDAKGAAFPSEVSKSAPAPKFRLKKLFERQFTAALRYSSIEKVPAGYGDGKEREPSSELEPSSLCLARMVQSFMESGPNERPAPPPRCGRRRCNCFNGNCDDLSDDDLDFGDIFPSAASSHGDAVELLKSLVPCASMAERNLLADASKIMEKSSNRACCGGRGTRGGGDCRKIVADGLAALGHDASICLSRWDKSPSFPAGEYEYLDVIVNGGGERLIVDLDFRSEFEIARSTKSYRAALQALPMIFVGREDRLVEIITVMSEAARQSLKKKGLHVPPWRKPEYMRAKWLSPSRRLYPPPPPPPPPPSVQTNGGGDDSGDGRCGDQSVQPPSATVSGELELRCEESGQPVASPPPSPAETEAVAALPPPSPARRLPAVNPKQAAPPPQKGGPWVVTGLASIVSDLHHY